MGSPPTTTRILLPQFLPTSLPTCSSRSWTNRLVLPSFPNLPSTHPLFPQLEEMDAAQLDEELLAPVPTNKVKTQQQALPSAPTGQVVRPAAAQSPAKSKEDLELEALQAEMEAL